MNRKKVNGPIAKGKNECDSNSNSNSTDSFDMNDFKSSSLTKKYSVQIHKNNADLMAELNSINIMGDESDVEIIEPRADQNGLSVSANGSKIACMNTTQSSDDRQNGEFENDKHERILAWAQSQSQNLSMCVASVLSDHDYLSQELLLGIIAGNEENTDMENRRESNSNNTANDDKEPKEQNGDLDKETTNTKMNGAAEATTTQSNNEKLNTINIDDLNAILKQLTSSKERAQSLSLLEKIEEKTKQMKAQLNGDQTDVNKSTDTSPEFSPDHSEPLEYYGGIKFSAQSSVEDAKESDSSDMVLELRSELKAVDDIANRVSIDTTSIQTKLTNIENQPETERAQTIGKLRENLALLVEDMAKELTKMAIKLNPNKASNESESTIQKAADRKAKSRSLSDSSDGEESDKSESRRRSRKLKRRRKVPKSQAKLSDSTTDLSSNSEDMMQKGNVKSEPYVISQNIDDLMNGNASNSANESIRKENDFLGFDNDDDDDVDDDGFEIGIKTELNDTFSSQQPTSEKNVSQSKNGPKDRNMESDESIEIIHQNKQLETESQKQQSTENSAIERMEIDADHSSSVASLSDTNDLIDEDDDDDDDEDIRRLLDFSSLGSKRIASTHTAAKVNGIVEPKKSEPKKKPPKEDGLEKILADSLSEDIHKPPAESESEEKSDRIEEYTEEHFLKEQNEQYKEQLLLTSDSEMDSDSDGRVNGKDSEFDSESDSDGSSNSNQSLVAKFLADESEGRGRKLSNEAKKEGKPKGNKTSTDSEKEAQSKTKESSKNKNSSEKVDDFDDDLDSDIEFDMSESGSVSEAPRKSKSTVGKNVFSNIEKDKHIVIPSDEEDGSGSESKKKSSSDKQKIEADSSGKDSVALDTTMFKTSKKVHTQNQLSKILQSRSNKQSTSRISPECISVSSDDDYETESTSTEKKNGNDDDDGEEKEKRNTRKLLRHDQLADDTKLAQREESDRIKRLDKKNERLTQFMESQRQSQAESEHEVDPNEVVLDFDTKKDEKVVVHPEITKHLKAHQVEGIKFMYDCCYGSVDNLEKYPGSGCILAHCMGLGKTLQLITLLHTVICYPQLKTDKVLVICPKSTVMNWKEEIERWLGNIKQTRRLKLFHFPEASDINSKLKTLQDWSKCGTDSNKQAGCLLLGYEAFRVLVFYHNSKKSQSLYSGNELDKMRKSIHKYLLDPGADLVVCDEGHMIKNQKSTTSLAVNKIKTKRRIVLTGTPIQNNLKEYYSMVNFIKPSFLGTEKEFANLYVNPIKNGQHKDSSKSEIKYMKQRSYVLHKKLSRFVQRKEAALLKSFLPEKYEFVLFIPMTKIQTDLYEFFLENRPNQDQKGKSLIPDYTVLRKIWTHPKVLENAYLNAIQNKTKVKPPPTVTPANDSDDDQPDDVFDSQTGQMSVTSDWWRSHLTDEDLETILPSNKLKILFEILNRCRRNKEKCLIFSAFVAVLDVVEFFMHLINDQEKQGNKPGLETFRGPWELGKDYYRLDGKTAKNHRHSMITNFNDPKNERTRAFLISAKAGGQGINLIGANRVVLLDTSWNPSNDQQNIFRVFRLGQKRICYIYRLLSMGTMEEKVYSRSVTKQAMSCRVVDEQQIDRHYNTSDLSDLYTLTKPNMNERPTPNVPKDDLLAQLLMKFPEMVYKYHEHDSLLENKGEEELSEQEKNDAWTAYEADVKRKNETNMGPYSNNFGGMLPNYSGLGSYANSLFNNYNNLSGLNYPYNMSNMYGSYNPYSVLDGSMRFDNYSQFYNNLMNVAGTSMSNYNPSNSSLLSPNHSSSVSSPSPIMNMNSFSSSSPSSRNWMQSNASSSNYANNLLSSFAQSSSSSKGYSSYLNTLYNALGTNNPPPAAAPNASSSKTPPLQLPGTADFNTLAYLQKQHLSNMAMSSNPISSTTQLAGNSSAQQGPNALRNPLLTKELSIPRNPTIANAKEMFNLPIPTSVITKSATGTSSPLSTISPGSSNQSDISKSSSKSPDISSSVDKSVPKPTKNTGESLLSVKNTTTINNNNNNVSRDSPDTTGAKRVPSKSTTSVSNGVSSTVDSTKKPNNKSATTVTPISSNMGIVYPQQKPAQAASTSKATSNATILIPTNDKAKEKSSHNPVSNTSPVLNKSPSQPMPAIIRKPSIQSSATKSSDLANDAVAAISNNKNLTVTARTVTSPVAKNVPVTGVNNSITLSPISNSASKLTASGVTITPQLSQTKVSTPTPGRTLSPISKSNSSSPIAISKVTMNQTMTKSPTPVTKPNILSSRNTNTAKTFVSVPKTSNAVSPVPMTPRSNQSVSSKIVVQRTSPSAGFKPIYAQTKAQAQAAQTGNKPASNSAVQINRVVTPVKTTQSTVEPSLTRPRITANRANTTITPINTRKRPPNEPITNIQAKKSKPLNSNSIALTSTTRLSPKPTNSLTGIRISRPTSQQANSQKVNSQVAVPVEIVELE